VEVIAGFRRALEAAVAQRAALPEMAARARDRIARDYLWEVKARKVAACYRSILEARGSSEAATIAQAAAG
jgi:hypothetical protein